MPITGRLVMLRSIAFLWLLALGTAGAETVTVRFDGFITDLSTDASTAGTSLNGASLTVYLSYDPTIAPTSVLDDGRTGTYRGENGGVFDLRIFVGDFYAESLFDSGTIQILQALNDSTTFGPGDIFIVNAFPLARLGGNIVGGAAIGFFGLALTDSTMTAFSDISLPGDLSTLVFDRSSGSIEFGFFGTAPPVIREFEISSISVVPLPAPLVLLVSGCFTLLATRRYTMKYARRSSSSYAYS